MLINLRNALMAGGPEPAPAYWGLCFTAEKPGSTIQLTRTGTSTKLVVKLEYSRDGKIWTPYTIGETITLSDVGDKVYFAADDGGNPSMGYNSTNYHTFATGAVAASGDISSLLDRNSSVAALTSNYTFSRLFSGCTSLSSAPELPAQTLSTDCYREMFSGCTSLVSAPELPAQTLGARCYISMFSGCTSLVSAPELPAQTLESACYREMFSGCTSLVSAPELPAQTLESTCYRQMFSGCTSLVSAPELPAQTLGARCYISMFSGCTSLSDIKVHFTTWGTSTTDWVDGVAALGLFHCPAALPHAASDFTTSKIPPGWTVETF